MSNGCNCGDPYCPNCGDPDRAKVESFADKIYSEVMELSPAQAHCALISITTFIGMLKEIAPILAEEVVQDLKDVANTVNVDDDEDDGDWYDDDDDWSDDIPDEKDDEG